MIPRSSLTRAAAPLILLAGALTVASCGSTNSSTTPGVVASPSPSSSASTTATVTVPAAGGKMTLPTVDGLTPTMSFAAGAAAGTTVDVSVSATKPANVPLPSSLERKPQSVSGAVPFAYVTLTVRQLTNSATTTSLVIASESINLSSSDPASASYFTELDQVQTSSDVSIGDFGPGVVTGASETTQNATAISATGPTLTSAHSYVMQFFYVPVASASPTPSPTPTSTASSSPTSTPSPSPSPSPSSSASGTYTFSGGSGSAECSPTCGSALTIADSPYAFSAQFGTASTAATISGALSIGTTQITPTGFSALTGAGTVALYLELSSSKSVTFAQSPSITLAHLSSVTACVLYEDVTFGWSQIVPSSGSDAVNNGSVTLPATSIGTAGLVSPFAIGTTPTFFLVSCS